MADSLGNFRWVYLPYCLMPVGDGRYAVVNRSYKPLGSTTNAHVDYATDPNSHKILGLTPAKIVKIAWSGVADSDGRVYLYDDGSVPTATEENWKAYQKRLAVLAKLSIE